jgi:hypothetical protein
MPFRFRKHKGHDLAYDVKIMTYQQMFSRIVTSTFFRTMFVDIADTTVPDTEKYQPARQNMKLVTRSLRSLATKLHILARQADIFGINQFTSG